MPQIINKPVRNFTTGRQGYRPEAIVIHIAEGYLAGAYDWFNRSESLASSHYMVGKAGEIWKFISEEDTAWHAGGVANPTWRFIKSGINPNLYTIGIEHEGFTGESWTEAMYNSTAWLIKNMSNQWQIPIDRDHIIGHNQINSVSRDRCPGTGVDFERLIQLARGEEYEDPIMIRELQQKVQSLEAAQADLLNQITSLQLQNAALENENRKLKGDLAQVPDNTVTDLVNQNRKLMQEVYTLQQLRNKLTKQIEDLEKGTKPESSSVKGMLTSFIDRFF